MQNQALLDPSQTGLTEKTSQTTQLCPQYTLPAILIDVCYELIKWLGPAIGPFANKMSINKIEWGITNHNTIRWGFFTNMIMRTND